MSHLSPSFGSDARTGFTIREARASDLGAAARVRARCWRESFAGVLPDDVLDNADAWAPEVARGWASELRARGATYWLGVDADGEIVGIAHADAAVEADAPASVELRTLYVLERAKGSGLAKALLHRALVDDLAAHLWVIEGNERAIRFYRKRGFEPDGAVRDIQPGWPGGRQLRMVRQAGRG